jgi:hypothetical protein
VGSRGGAGQCVGRQGSPVKSVNSGGREEAAARWRSSGGDHSLWSATVGWGPAAPGWDGKGEARFNLSSKSCGGRAHRGGENQRRRRPEK